MNPTPSNVTPDMQTEKAPLGLKILVVGLGVAIIVMLLLIIFKVAAGDHRSEEAVVSTPAAESIESQAVISTASKPVLADARISLPEGAQIMAVIPAGQPLGADMIFQVQLPDGTQALHILNRRTGEVSRVLIEVGSE